jgi:hypothetical protein
MGLIVFIISRTASQIEHDISWSSYCDNGRIDQYICGFELRCRAVTDNFTHGVNL